MSDTPTSTDNATIQEMRAQIDSLTRDLKAAPSAEELAALKSERDELKSKVTEAEREKMTEIQRLQSELEELKPFKDQATNLTQQWETVEKRAQSEYEGILAGVTDEAHRAAVERLSAQGSWMDRVDLARHAVSILPQPQPKAAGTVTQPDGSAGGDTPPTDGAKEKVDTKPEKVTSWNQAFAGVGAKVARASQFSKTQD